MNHFKLLYRRFSCKAAGWLSVCALAAALASPAGLHAQSRNVTGKVIDAEGSPVAGAVIEAAGTQAAAITRNDGVFSLTVPSVAVSLTVSCEGYVPGELKLNNRSDYTITLESENKKIDEVVIVAYGTQKRVSVSGSLSSVGSTELKRSPVANFATSLAGRLPGLTVSQSTGMPGNEQVALFLRGMSTYGDASPLILIDGVPREYEVFNSLDANEVADVTILKDAAATAVFGVRGANGVILVTTQRGSSGRAAVNITAEFGIQQMLTRGSVKMDSWDYAELLNERARGIASKSGTTYVPVYNEWQIEQFRNGSDPVFFPNRDPYKEYTKLGNQTKVNANISGGTERIQYFINATYIDQESIFRFTSKKELGYDPSIWLKRINVRSNIDYKINDRLKVSLNLSSYLNRRNMIVWGDGLIWSNDLNFNSAGTGYILGGLNRVPPTAPGPTIPPNTYDRDGNLLPEGGWVQDGSGYQLYPRMNLGGYINQIKATVNSSAAIDWDMGGLLKGLSFNAMFSYDLYAMGFTKGTRGYNRYGFYQAKSPDDQSYFERQYSDNAFDGYHAEDGLSFYKGGRDQSSEYKFNSQASLKYSRNFNAKHDVNVMLLGQLDNKVSNAAVSGYLPYNMLYMSARATYTYDNRYTVEANLGINASEQFAEGNRTGIFPAVSASWMISEEKFFKNNVNVKWVDFLKLRASYGLVGNDRVADGARFLYLDNVRVVSGGSANYPAISPTLGSGNYVTTTLMGNSDLTWETARQQNYGIDIGFLKGFNFSMDYFREMRTDILISRQTVPMVQGLSPGQLPRVNMGTVFNHGYETVLSYTRRFGTDWSMFLSGNFNFARNKVLEADEVKLETGRGGYLYEYRTTGFPIGQSWVLQVDYNDGAGNGYINTEEDLAKYEKMYSDGGFVQAYQGQWKFIDQNGDGIIDSRDQIPYGYPNTIPEITYGATMSLSWRNLDFSMQWQGVAHRQGVFVVGMMGNGHLTGEWELHAWTPERFAAGEKITYQMLNGSTLAGGSVNDRSDYVVSDMSYVRLKNLELGYSLPQKAVRKMGMGGIRFAVTGQNLWNTNNMKTSSMDPEQNNENQYPLTRNVALSVSLQF